MANQIGPTEFLKLSTKVVEDLKAWIDQARGYHGLSTDQLVTMNAAAEIIDQTAIRVGNIKAL
jgi:hypothetical protein